MFFFLRVSKDERPVPFVRIYKVGYMRVIKSAFNEKIL